MEVREFPWISVIGLDLLKKTDPPRVIKTHLPFQLVPPGFWENKCKVSWSAACAQVNRTRTYNHSNLLYIPLFHVCLGLKDHLRGAQCQGQPGELLPLRLYESDTTWAGTLGWLRAQVHARRVWVDKRRDKCLHQTPDTAPRIDVYLLDGVYLQWTCLGKNQLSVS